MLHSTHPFNSGSWRCGVSCLSKRMNSQSEGQKYFLLHSYEAVWTSLMVRRRGPRGCCKRVAKEQDFDRNVSLARPPLTRQHRCVFSGAQH